MEYREFVPKFEKTRSVSEANTMKDNRGTSNRE
jgi:hypothetical protein